MPTSRPSRLTSAPPELPGLMAASVWMKKLEIVDAAGRARQRRDDAAGHGLVQTPNGLPIASTTSPTSIESRIAHLEEGELFAGVLDAQQGKVVAFVGGDELGVELAPVEQHDADLLRALHDVGIGDDQPVGLDQHARAQRVLHPLALLGHARNRERQAAHPRGRGGVNVDHGRRHALDQRREGIGKVAAAGRQGLRQHRSRGRQREGHPDDLPSASSTTAEAIGAVG